MKRPLASVWLLALIVALSPESDCFGQSSPRSQLRHQGQAQYGVLDLRALEGAQVQQGKGPWNSGANALWRNLVVDPASQNLTFAWVDSASQNSGMTLAPADPSLRAHLDLPKDAGLIVTAIESGSPAFAAGIRQNDVLIRIGEDTQKNTPLGKPQDLEAGLKAAGDQPVTLMVLRGGKRLSLKVQPRVKVGLGPVHPEAPTYWIGISVTPIEPALRSQLELPAKQGLIAMEVVKDGPAEKAGVRRYDILLKYDDVDLPDQSSLTKLVQSRGERTTALLILRAGHRRELKITPERRTAAVTFFRISEPQSAGFDIVLPGGVLSGLDADASQILSGAGDQPPAGKSTEQRLDELTTQIKELRQAVEVLSRAQEKK